MKANILIAISILMSMAVAHGGPSVSGGVGPSDTLVCSSPDNSYQLSITANGILTLWAGSLQVESNTPVDIKCSFSIKSLGQWSCIEDRAGEGRYLVSLAETDNGTSGAVYQEQMSPLPPVKLADLNCHHESGTNPYLRN